MKKNLFNNILNRKIHIRIAFFTALSIFLLITVFIVSALSYYTSTSAIIKMADSNAESITKRVRDNTMSYIQNPINDLKVIARSAGKGDIISDHKNIWNIMWESVQNTPQIISIYIGDVNGNFIQSRKAPEFATRIVNRSSGHPSEKWYYRDAGFNILKTEEKKQIYDPRERPWFKDTVKAKKSYMTDVYVFYTAKAPGITATFPILSGDGSVRSVVAADILLDQLSKFIVEQKVSEHGIVFITDDQNNLIAYPNVEKIIKKDDKSGELRFASVDDLDEIWIKDAVKNYRKTGQQHFKIRSKGSSYISAFTSFQVSSDKKWEIGVIIPESDLTGSGRRMILVSLLISVLILIAAFYFLNIITGHLAGPILMLAKQTEHVKDFDLDQVVGVESHYKEVDVMNKSIMAMKEGLFAFKKYVPSDVVKHLIKTGEGAKLGGKNAELALMFTDIAKFTTIAESMTTENLMSHLSEYLSELSTIIIDSQGTIDKYIGDAIMSFWGAPVEIENPSLHACCAALNCTRRLADLNLKWADEGKPPFHTRFGIHTGDVIIGNMGSEERLNYTVIGDSVNLASRLEGTNKEYNTDILISESTYEYVKDHIYCRVIDKVAVMGKNHGVIVYQPLGFKSEKDEAAEEVCALYLDAFNRYQSGDFKGSYKLFKKSWDENKDRTSLALANRAVILLKEGIPENWNGIRFMTHK